MIFQVKWIACGFKKGSSVQDIAPKRAYSTIYTFTYKSFRNNLNILILCIFFWKFHQIISFLR